MAGEREGQETSGERIASDLKSLVGDAEELLRVTANQAGEKVSVARQKIEQSLTEGKRALEQAEKQALERASPELERATDGDFQDLVERCLNQVEHAREKMIRDQYEIDRLKVETRAMIARLLAA
jgi:ElaB/YqjD/DUF883 family membrane-anchored ribosome-binding protein